MLVSGQSQEGVAAIHQVTGHQWVRVSDGRQRVGGGARNETDDEKDLGGEAEHIVFMVSTTLLQLKPPIKQPTIVYLRRNTKYYIILHYIRSDMAKVSYHTLFFSISDTSGAALHNYSKKLYISPQNSICNHLFTVSHENSPFHFLQKLLLNCTFHTFEGDTNKAVAEGRRFCLRILSLNMGALCDITKG